MKTCKLLIFILMAISLVGCSLFEHRDFSDEMDQFGAFNDEPMFRANRDFMIMAGDTGTDFRSKSSIRKRTPATYSMRQEDLYSSSLRRELGHLESRMNDEDYFEYEGVKHQLGGVSEQIYYLRLPAREKRLYLQSKQIAVSSPKNQVNYGQYAGGRVPLYQQDPKQFQGDVVVGMDKDQVVGNWGAPERRDIAGDPELQNERWAFRRNGKIKYIFFEQGKVQGWSEQ